VEELIHPPPVTASDNVVDELVQTVGLPNITVGARLTFTVVVVLQPLDKVYVITVVPKAIAVTKPDEAPIVATPGNELAHVPPAITSDAGRERPTHTNKLAGVMAAGVIFTVTVFKAEHPAALV